MRKPSSPKSLFSMFIIFMFIALSFTLIQCDPEQVASATDKTTSLDPPAIIPETVADPTFSPVEGGVGIGTVVNISSSTTGTTIYYTTDGVTSPTCAGTGTQGTSVTVSAATTIIAIACKSGLTDSQLSTASYTIIKTCGTAGAGCKADADCCPGLICDMASIQCK